MACGRSALPATRYWPFRRLAGEKDSGRPANRDGCESMLPGRGYGRCNIIMGQEDDMTGVTLQRAYGHSIPVLSAAMAGVLVAGANVSRRAWCWSGPTGKRQWTASNSAVSWLGLCRPASLRASWSCPASWFGLHEVGEAAVRPQHPGYTRPRWGTSWRVHAGLGGLAGDEESAPSFGHLRILPADLSELGSGLRVDRRRALLCGPCACDGRSERRRSLVRVARPSGWDLANPHIRERMSARTLVMWVDPSGTGRCVPRAV